ncbi:MAG: hypothetical protein R3272_03365 [Candidatus Promineifilaceae bacterium]|nr:hypothetical protein [Candidatus Promineifilaceae bacterium]
MSRVIPIYRSDGAWIAVYNEGHIFSASGDWLGFVVGREVYSRTGDYLGFLSDDRRLLRKRSADTSERRYKPPRPPAPPSLPATMPLAPLMRELPYHIIDVFEEMGESLAYVSETRPDME